MRLKGLSQMIQHVYLPFMENKTEIKLHMEKFVRQIGITMQQAYGNVTINVPPVPNQENEELIKDPKLMALLEATIVSTSTHTSTRKNGLKPLRTPWKEKKQSSQKSTLL